MTRIPETGDIPCNGINLLNHHVQDPLGVTMVIITLILHPLLFVGTTTNLDPGTLLVDPRLPIENMIANHMLNPKTITNPTPSLSGKIQVIHGIDPFLGLFHVTTAGDVQVQVQVRVQVHISLPPITGGETPVTWSEM
jgi:hypothetical protein